MSQQQLADVIGVSQQSVNKYENHSIEPDVATLIKIADYFGVTVDYLIGHANEREAERRGITDEEFSIVSNYRKLSQKERESIFLIMKVYTRENQS